jgi:hypothetical protein
LKKIVVGMADSLATRQISPAEKHDGGARRISFAYDGKLEPIQQH